MTDKGENLYEIQRSNQFKKDYKRIVSRGLDVGELRAVIQILARGQKLEESYKDHSLGGNYFGHRECHIHPDWLLIYRLDNDTLTLTAVRTGTHSDLF